MEHHAASPTPGGLVAFAVACYTFVGVFAGLVPGEGLFLLGCWLLGGFVVQILVASKEIDHGVQLGGNVFLFFQGFFMLTGAISSMAKYLCLYVWETPFNTIHLQNMLTLSQCGAVIMPACPSFYNKPASLEELADFFAARVLDQMGLHDDTIRRWDGI